MGIRFRVSDADGDEMGACPWCGSALLLALLGCLFAPRPGSAQSCSALRPDRSAAIVGTYVAGEALAAAFHPDDWWQGPVGAFRLSWIANGGSPAAGQDYLLHVTASYEASQAAALAWEWACASPMTAAWLGASTAFAVGLPKKIVDGFHGTGFELAKNLANAVGALLPVVHRRWPVTRAVVLKGWYWPSGELLHRAGPEPNLLSDYAGQRYYLSVNPARAGARPAWWPAWLGVAVGHSVTSWATAPPHHEWYGTLDLELRELPVMAKWWPAVASVLDQLHFPAPGIRLSGRAVKLGMF